MNLLTTQEIRNTAGKCPPGHAVSKVYEENVVKFDAWLNEVKAEAWTEGFDKGFYRGQILSGDYDASEAGIENPYEVG